MIEVSQNGAVAHYTSDENLEHILKNQKIRLSHVEGFDDPRESSLDWISTEGIGDGPDIAEWKKAEALKESIGRKLNILCVCGPIKDHSGSCPIESSPYGRPRMWSQYGRNSKGFCLIFNQEKLNSELTKIAYKPEHLISGEVEYLEWLHFVDGGSVIQYWSGNDFSDTDLFELVNDNYMLKSIYFKKSIDWRDESEFRWLLYTEDEAPVLIPINNCLEGVVLGCDFPNDKVNDALRYCNDLECPCYRLKYQHPKYQIIKM